MTPLSARMMITTLREATTRSSAIVATSRILGIIDAIEFNRMRNQIVIHTVYTLDYIHEKMKDAGLSVDDVINTDGEIIEPNIKPT